MKKFLISTNILTLLVIYFNSCSSTSTTTSSNSIIHKNSKSIAINYSNNPFTGIDVNLANYMVDKFKSSLADTNDTRSVWFNLDTLKRFIWHIEKESQLKGFGSQELEKLGLRIYYGIYPSQSTWASTYPNMIGVNTTFENKHTVFIIPTYFDGTFNREFDPTKFASDNPIPLRQQLNEKNTTLYALGATNPDVDLQNHGDLIPPMNGNYRGADFMEFADKP
jgi:hypothetical protein